MRRLGGSKGSNSGKDVEVRADRKNFAEIWQTELTAARGTRSVGAIEEPRCGHLPR
jgi:hypothetical protein